MAGAEEVKEAEGQGTRRIMGVDIPKTGVGSVLEKEMVR